MKRTLITFFGFIFLSFLGCENSQKHPSRQTQAEERAPEPVVQKSPLNAKSDLEQSASSVKKADLDLCANICQRSLQLKCGPLDICLDGCRDMIEISVCNDLMQAFLQCLIKEPLDHFTCDERGVAAIEDGYCDQEQAKFAECFKRSGQLTK